MFRVMVSMVSTDELLAQVLRLPREERARLADEVFASLREPEETVAEAWAGELERRSQEIATGQVQTVDSETARTRILDELERRRASRATS